MNVDLKDDALNFHSAFPQGKIGICVSKDVFNNMTLSYSPGVAFPCIEINKNKENAKLYTNISNSVAIISNGTAVLGLGNLGAIASKPVMEGKAALFKMAGINCFDIEINANEVDEMFKIISSFAGFGGINLEDIAAPECFDLEEKLSSHMDIPIFHDDQHGVAIVTCAAIKNALELVNKRIEEVKIVVMGAGAAAISSMRMMVKIGAKKSNIIAFDSKGAISEDRIDCNKYKMEFASSKSISLEDAIVGADIFFGASSGGKLSKNLLQKMARDPIIIATANPYPEIHPNDAKEIRKDAIVCTGRSDFPNQVNNLLCFPYIFRVALDNNLKITDDMKISTIDALSTLGKSQLNYDREHLLPSATNPQVQYLLPGMILSNLKKRDTKLDDHSLRPMVQNKITSTEKAIKNSSKHINYSLSYINRLTDNNLFLTGDKYYLGLQESAKMEPFLKLLENMIEIKHTMLIKMPETIPDDFVYLFYSQGHYSLVFTQTIDEQIIQHLKPKSIINGKPSSYNPKELIGGIHLSENGWRIYYNPDSSPAILLMLSLNLGNIVQD